MYAFVAPDAPDHVTLISNWIPIEEPSGGPNFHAFGDDVLYTVNVDNDGDAVENIVYEWRFRTETRNPETFLYNTGPIDTIDDPDWNRPQYYTLTRVEDGQRTELATDPPVRVGARSTPDYEALADAATYTLEDGTKTWAGQRDDSFFVDLGSVFDLGGLRPLNPAHVAPLDAEAGVDGLSGFNVHTVALQVPKAEIVGDDPVIGVWSETYRRKTRVYEDTGGLLRHEGPWVQVSRLGMPLVNELVIPLSNKDAFNASKPAGDGQFQPANVTPGEMLRLNTSIASTPFDQQNRLGLLAGQADGFPNGRRLIDDVTDIELQAVAGATPLGACDGAAPNNAIGDGVDANDRPFMAMFPYLATPWSRYAHPHGHTNG